MHNAWSRSKHPLQLSVVIEVPKTGMMNFSRFTRSLSVSKTGLFTILPAKLDWWGNWNFTMNRD